RLSSRPRRRNEEDRVSSAFERLQKSGLGFQVWSAANRRPAATRPPRHRHSYWAEIPTVVCDFTTGGGFHLPVSASDFGAYRRIVRLKAPFGAGSQLASSS